MPKKTGPLTDAGKSISSQNALTHGMTSRRLLVQGENQEDLDALHRRWHDAYPTTDPYAAELVAAAANSEWILLRNQRQYDLLNQQLFQTSMLEWSKHQHEQYQLFTRYLTTAQRALDRDRRAIQQHRRELRAGAREQRAVQTAAEAATTRQKAAETSKPRAFPDCNPYEINDDHLEQRAFIQCENGQTKTILNPPNDFLLRVARYRYPTTTVLRFLNFETSPIPPEYAAFADRAAQLKPNESILLPLTVNTFRLAIERETDGHVQHWPDLAEIDQPIFQEKRNPKKNLGP